MSGYVLILDDDAPMRELLEMALTEEGYEVQTAANVTEALAKCQERPPHVILFDLILGHQSGEAFIRAYRELPDANAQLIAVSGASGLEHRAAELEVTTFLLKPWDLDDLVRSVGAAFDVASH
jgi:DNA-binding response OmpR family regulator